MKRIRTWLSLDWHGLSEFHREESGQDLIEYALIAALIALAATVGMGSVATALNDIFSSIGDKINTYIT